MARRHLRGERVSPFLQRPDVPARTSIRRSCYAEKNLAAIAAGVVSITIAEDGAVGIAEDIQEQDDSYY